jgi:hypothetical protein
VVVATADGFEPLAARTAPEIAALANAARRWPAGADRVAEQLVWLGGSGAGLQVRAAGASGPLEPKGCSARELVMAAARLYELGFDLRFERLYQVPRAALALPAPEYRFDTNALWTARHTRHRNAEAEAEAGASSRHG